MSGKIEHTESEKKVIASMWPSFAIGMIIIATVAAASFYKGKDIREILSIAGLVSLGILAVSIAGLSIYAIPTKNDYKKMDLAAMICCFIQLGMAMGVTLLMGLASNADLMQNYIRVNIYGIIVGDASAAAFFLNFLFALVFLMVSAYYQDIINEQKEAGQIPTTA
ncbi:MAG: hypothetical protein WC788_07450 [Candidatus Paceibacterota bacterium]|jgi:hypothetical protein